MIFPENNFDLGSVVNRYDNVLVGFCNNKCHGIKRKFKALDNHLSEDIKLVYLIDKYHKELFLKFDIKIYPTLILFNRRRPYLRMIGSTASNDFLTNIISDELSFCKPELQDIFL